MAISGIYRSGFALGGLRAFNKMNRLEQKFTLLKAIKRHEAQIDALYFILQKESCSICRDALYRLLDNHEGELESARAELKALDSPMAADVQFPTYMSIL